MSQSHVSALHSTPITLSLGTALSLSEVCIQLLQKKSLLLFHMLYRRTINCDFHHGHRHGHGHGQGQGHGHRIFIVAARRQVPCRGIFKKDHTILFEICALTPIQTDSGSDKIGNQLQITCKLARFILWGAARKSWSLSCYELKTWMHA